MSMKVDMKWGIAGLLQEVGENTRDVVLSGSAAERVKAGTERIDALGAYADYLDKRGDGRAVYLVKAVAWMGAFPWTTDVSSFWSVGTADSPADTHNGTIAPELFSLLAGGTRTETSCHYRTAMEAIDGLMRAIGTLLDVWVEDTVRQADAQANPDTNQPA